MPSEYQGFCWCKTLFERARLQKLFFIDQSSGRVIYILEVLFCLSLVDMFNCHVGLQLIIVFSTGGVGGIDSSGESGYGKCTVFDEPVRVSAMCSDGGMFGLRMFSASVVQYCWIYHEAMRTDLESVALGRNLLR